MKIFMYVLSFSMIILSLVALHMKNLVSAIITVGGVSLASAIIFLYLQAPDVAMTEAAIGAGLTTLIFFIALRKTEGDIHEK